jgi:hypothetical protein
MEFSFSEASRILDANKRLGRVPKWAIDNPKWLEIVSPLLIGGEAPMGLRLRCKALKQFPNEAVTIQLEIAQGRARHSAIWRIEWRPLRPHTNPYKGAAKELHGMRIAGSHEHCLPDNHVPDTDRILSEGIRLARPITPDPQTFEDLLAYAKGCLKISDLEAIPPPDWQMDIFGAHHG